MQIILNHLPPANLILSSAANSILSTFINKNGFQSKVIYWNCIFDDLFFNLYTTRGDFENLFPFYYMLAVKYKDEELISRLKIRLFKEKMSLRLLDDSIIDKELSNVESKIKKKVKDVLSQYLNKNEKIVFGFSFKLYQWIPAIVIADIVKDFFPKSIILFGGITDSELANSLLNNFKTIDFIIKGEGELSLLEFCNCIEKDLPFDNIEGLCFRKGDENIFNPSLLASVYEKVDYIIPDHNDLVTQCSKPKDVFITLDTIRGCAWNKCRFCALNKGYIYYERNPVEIINEIEINYQRFGICKYSFTDNDICGKTKERINVLLDLLIELNVKYEHKLKFAAEVLHLNFNKDQIKKFSEAGFVDIQIGHEALSDSLLTKMNKRTRFAHNLFFIKHALEGEISLGVNLIAGVPNEDWQDLWETSQNMHYLRFFLSNKIFTQEIVPFYLDKGSPYYSKTSIDEKEKYIYNDVIEYLPSNLISKEDRFNYFGFHKKGNKQTTWEDIDSIQQYYKKIKFSYHLEKLTLNSYEFHEYINDQLYYKLELEQIHIEIFRIIDMEVMPVEKLFTILQKEESDLNLDYVKAIIDELKEVYLIYSDSNYQYITSVITINENF